jgi:hypothetical protein
MAGMPLNVRLSLAVRIQVSRPGVVEMVCRPMLEMSSALWMFAFWAQ